LSSSIRNRLEKVGVIYKGYFSDNFREEFEDLAFPVYVGEFRKKYSQTRSMEKAERHAINAAINTYLKNR